MLAGCYMNRLLPGTRALFHYKLLVFYQVISDYVVINEVPIAASEANKIYAH